MALYAAAVAHRIIFVLYEQGVGVRDKYSVPMVLMRAALRQRFRVPHNPALLSSAQPA